MHFRPRLIICFLPSAIRYGAKSCSLKNICSTVATLLFSPYLVSKPGKRPAKSQQQHFYKVEVPARDSRARHRAKNGGKKGWIARVFIRPRFLLYFVQRRPTKRYLVPFLSLPLFCIRSAKVLRGTISSMDCGTVINLFWYESKKIGLFSLSLYSLQYSSSFHRCSPFIHQRWEAIFCDHSFRFRFCVFETPFSETFPRGFKLVSSRKSHRSFTMGKNHLL